MIELSIIIPMYNAENYIEKCIESITACSSEEIEILIVDDGSSDGSVEIVKERMHYDARIRLLRQENSGVSCARNYGINMAKGRYITFVDADDWVETEALLYLIAKVRSEHNISLILTNYNEVYEKKSVNQSWKYLNKVSLDELNEAIAIDYRINFCWGKIFNRSTIIENKIKFKENVKIGEDIIFIIDYVEYIEEAQYYNVNFYNYRHNSQSVMNGSPLNKLQELQYEYMRKQEFWKKHSDRLNMIKSNTIFWKLTIYYLYQCIERKIDIRQVINMAHISAILKDNVVDNNNLLKKIRYAIIKWSVNKKCVRILEQVIKFNYYIHNC